MFIVGLTGGLATGKSTVLSIFKDHNIPVIDADQIAREIVEPGKESWHFIKKEFGDKVLTNDGHIDRAILGKIVFEDAVARRKLNKITHPQIRWSLVKIAIQTLLRGHPFIVMELPLLFETQSMIYFMHKIITVTCEDGQQLERLCERNDFTSDVAIKRINSQMPLDQKVAQSHFVIDNSGSVESTRQQAEKVITVLKTVKFHWYLRIGVAALVIGSTVLLTYVKNMYF